MISRIDHISIAVKDYPGALDFFTKIFNTTPGASSTNEELGFFWEILSAGDLSRLELLTPAGNTSFLHSFLAEKKEGGVHHITFETPDIHSVRQNLERHEVPYFGYNDDNPAWKELFIHPKDAFGVLIQIAEFSPSEWLDPELSFAKGVKWSVKKATGGGKLHLSHPGGGKTGIDLSKQEIKRLIEDLQTLL